MGLISRVSSRTYRFSLQKARKMELGMDRSFQAQPTVRLVRNKSAKQAVAKRYTKKSVGFGIKNPAFAKQGDFIDKKCPFTGNVSIRGRLLTGVVTTLKMQRTCTIRRDYLHFVKNTTDLKKGTKTSQPISPQHFVTSRSAISSQSA